MAYATNHKFLTLTGTELKDGMILVKHGCRVRVQKLKIRHSTGRFVAEVVSYDRRHTLPIAAEQLDFKRIDFTLDEKFLVETRSCNQAEFLV